MPNDVAEPQGPPPRIPHGGLPEFAADIDQSSKFEHGHSSLSPYDWEYLMHDPQPNSGSHIVSETISESNACRVFPEPSQTWVAQGDEAR
jgi:hypothetical protein